MLCDSSSPPHHWSFLHGRLHEALPTRYPPPVPYVSLRRPLTHHHTPHLLLPPIPGGPICLWDYLAGIHNNFSTPLPDQDWCPHPTYLPLPHRSHLSTRGGSPSCRPAH